MKVLFTADWHIKLGQKNIPIDWQKNRFQELYAQLNKIIISKKVDLVVLGGDTFDRLPTIEELELYFSFLHEVEQNVDIIVYPGNHEAIKKNTTFLTSLKLVTKRVNPRARVVDDYLSIDNIDIIPYNRLKEFKPDNFSGNILLTHVRGEIPPHVTPEIDLKTLSRWDLVLAGDLHSHSNTQLNIVYPGSPMTTSFHRSMVDTGVVLLDSETKKWEWVAIQVRQLLRKTVSNTKDMIKTDYHHTIYEVEGDIGDLATLQSNDLLDKKIVQRESLSALSLTRDMTLSEELTLYLAEILNIEATKIERILEVFNDNIKEA